MGHGERDYTPSSTAVESLSNSIHVRLYDVIAHPCLNRLYPFTEATLTLGLGK